MGNGAFNNLGDFGTVTSPDGQKRIVFSVFEMDTGAETIPNIQFSKESLSKKNEWLQTYKYKNGVRTDVPDKFSVSLEFFVDFVNFLNGIVSNAVPAKLDLNNTHYESTFAQLMQRIHLDYAARKARREQYRLSSGRQERNENTAPPPPPPANQQPPRQQYYGQQQSTPPPAQTYNQPPAQRQSPNKPPAYPTPGQSTQPQTQMYTPPQAQQSQTDSIYPTESVYNNDEDPF